MPPSHDTPPDPSDRIAAGLAKIGLVLRHEAWRSGARRGLTPTQSQILVELCGSTAPLGLRDIADRLAITMGTASEAVSALVTKRLVEKRRSTADRRAVLLRPTGEGRAAARETGREPDAITGAARALPGAEQANLVRGLASLIRELQERGHVPTARMCVGCRFFRPNEYPGEEKAHHCLYIGAPIGDSDLRFDCAEMEPIAAQLRPRLWSVFIEGRPLDDRGPGADAPDCEPQPSDALPNSNHDQQEN